MRKLFLFLLLTLSIQLFAQKKNSRGEKLVSTIEILNYDKKDRLFEKSTIRYVYKKDWVRTVDKHTVARYGGDIRTGETVSFDDGYIFNSGSLERTKYSGGDKTYDWAFVFYEYGLIKSERHYFGSSKIDGYVKFNYLYDENDRIQFMRYRWYAKYDGEIKMKPGEDKYEIKFIWENNNMFIDGFDMSYSDIKNDTNIDFTTFFIIGDNRQLFDDKGFIYSTELYGEKSLNVLTVFNNFSIESIIDNNGNISEIQVINTSNNKLRKHILIHYLY